MSARVVYLERGDRGTGLRALRLCGPTSDESWRAPAVDGAYAEGAAWVAERITGARAANALSMLCLDLEGAACAWLEVPQGVETVGALARSGPMTEGDGPTSGGGNPFEFFAPSDFESTIQRIGGAGARASVVATRDVPARLLIDELDAAGIPVESVGTFWHAMALAWSGFPGRNAGPTAAPLVAVVLIDPGVPRLVWAWSQDGVLQAGGAMRLHHLRPAEGEPGTPEERVAVGEEEAARVTAEWLAWAAQLGRAPARVAVVAPRSARDGGGAFGRRLAASWEEATLDVVVVDDPVGETLQRAADALEKTPKDAPATPSLEALSARPGRAQRLMYVWAGAALALGSVGLVLVGMHLRERAAETRDAARAWKTEWVRAVGTVFPDITRPRLGMNELSVLREEVARRERNAKPPERSDTPMPVLSELDAVSLVAGDPNYAVESIELRSLSGARVTVLAEDTRAAEEFLDALRRVGGSHIVDWNATYTPQQVGGEPRVRGLYTGRWDPALTRPARPAGGAT